MLQIAAPFAFKFMQREPLSLLDDIDSAGDPQDVAWSYPVNDNFVQLELDLK